MAKLKAGVVGVGAMGRHHVRILAGMEGIELVGVADPGGDRYGAAAGVDLLPSVEALIARRPHMVVVAVPTVHHEAVAVQLAEAGIATMIEKPVAMSLEASERIQAAFERAGVFACVGHVERYNPAVAEMRRRVLQGELGTVYQVSTTRFSTFPARIGDVGVIMDLASHDINTTQWITDASYSSVSAQTAHRAGREHEDLVSVVARMDNGVVVNHQVNWLSPMKVRQTTVIGERGAFVADTARVSLSFWANGSVPSDWEVLQQFRGVTEGDMTRFALRTYEPLVAEDEAFRDAVLGTANATISLADGVETVRVAQACLESAQQGSNVHMRRGGESNIDE